MDVKSFKLFDRSLYVTDRVRWGLSLNARFMTRPIIIRMYPIDTQMFVRIPKHFDFNHLIKRLGGSVHFDPFLSIPLRTFGVWKVHFGEPETSYVCCGAGEVLTSPYLELSPTKHLLGGRRPFTSPVVDMIRDLGIVYLNVIV